MEDKIQQLTDKIYQEGVEKARVDATAILDEARQTAEKMIEAARVHADEIRQKTEKDLAEIKNNTDAELRLAGEQMMRMLKQKVADMITLQVSEGPVQNVLKDDDFVKNILLSVITHWKSSDGADEKLYLQLSEKTESGTVHFLENKIREIIGESFRIDLSQRSASGFSIGPDGGNYRISFTDAEFTDFFKRFLRPGTKKILFSNDKH
jgi:V/A-type H+/Na+-transporting ATPase subunit E